MVMTRRRAVLLSILGIVGVLAIAMAIWLKMSEPPEIPTPAVRPKAPTPDPLDALSFAELIARLRADVATREDSALAPFADLLGVVEAHALTATADVRVAFDTPLEGTLLKKWPDRFTWV